MRDQYAGDISDYLKFAFLRAVLPPDARLGVAWYYLEGHDGRADGRHDEYLADPDAWRGLDPALFDALNRRTGRSVADLETLGLLPTETTTYHRAPVPAGRARADWAARMTTHLASATAIFADPDNGVSRPGVLTRKSATADEIRALCAHGRLGLLIRFPDRTATHPVQLAQWHETFALFDPITVRTCVRVPHGDGSIPRIRWFTALNADRQTRARVGKFVFQVGALRGATAVVG